MKITNNVLFEKENAIAHIDDPTASCIIHPYARTICIILYASI